MLTGENGLLTKAGTAKDNTRGATVKEEVDLAISENNLAKYVGGAKNTKPSVVEKLYSEHKITDDEYYKLTGTNGETEVDVIQIGTITIDFSKLESGQSTGFQVGDYVKYGDKLTSGTTYTTKTAETGYESTQTFATNTSMLWRVLSVDGDKVELVATQNVLATDDTTGLYFKGQTGFLNAEIVLKDLCETLYNSTTGTARSIKVEDINNLTGFDPETSSWGYGGQSDNYNKTCTYTTGGPFWDKTSNTFITPDSTQTPPVEVTVANDYYYYTVDESLVLE